MYMIHLLMSDAPVVDDGAEAVGGSRLARELAGDREHLAQRWSVACIGLVERGEMRFRDDQEVHRRHRPDIVESHHLGVVINLLRGDFAARDLAENAIDRVAHVRSYFLPRAAFSSRPEIPSRRCISASTSPGPSPWRASRIMQWNQRSAVSRTRCSRSPLFAASTVSVASSPIFLRTESSPSASSRAT